MSHGLPPVEGNSPVAEPVSNIPDWLSLNIASPTRPMEREPWYYSFLEKYARVLLGCGVVLFAGFALLVLFPEIAVSMVLMLRRTMDGSEATATHDAIPAPVLRFLVRMAVIGLAFLIFLLPTLLTVAYILLSVEAGRNLRAIRQRGSHPT